MDDPEARRRTGSTGLAHQVTIALIEWGMAVIGICVPDAQQHAVLVR
jgi:hypothetical protein